MNVEIDSHHPLTAKCNIGNVLTQLANSKSTGCLKVRANKSEWSVFVESGQLLGIGCSVNSVAQESYRLRQLGCEAAATALNIATENTIYRSGENQIQRELDRLVSEGILDLTLGIQVYLEITKEALESLLWLQTGFYQWQQKKSIARLAIDNDEYRLDLAKLIKYYHQRLKIWQNYWRAIASIQMWEVSLF